MQTNLITETLPSPSTSLLIDRATLWDNSSKDDDNNLEKCVAPLNDQAWQSVGSLKDLIDSKYGLNINHVRFRYKCKNVLQTSSTVSFRLPTPMN